jgi:hypothetical protein
MRRRTHTLRLVCAGFALWFAVIGCGLLSTTSVGDLRSETKSVDLGSATTARVQINFAAGNLNVEGGANSLMDATFQYNVDDWKPEVKYSVNGSQGGLLVSQQEAGSMLPVGKQVINDWTIQLNEAVPLDLEIQADAGNSKLNLGALDLASLQVKVGAGTTRLDLSGNWDHDVTAAVNAEVGDLSINLPGEVGVRVNLDKDLVSLSTTGLTKDGDSYINQAFGTAPHTLTLVIRAGVGAIELVAP